MMKRNMWIALCAVGIVASILLYKTIDSEFTEEVVANIMVTLVFFVVAALTVVCGFNAAEDHDHAH